VTELFARVPLWLALDGGVRSLPAAARVALYDVAAAGGTIRCGAAPCGALEALCAGAGEHLDLLLDRGLIEIDVGRLSLVSPDGALWEGRSTQTSTADAPRVLAAPIEASARRSIAKALGARWSEKGLATAESRLAWIDSGAGAEYLRAHGVDVETAREIARGAGQRRGVFGRDRSPITRGVSTGVSESGGAVSRTGVSRDNRDTATGVSTGVSGLSPSRSPSEKESKNEGIPERATGVSESGVSRDTGSCVSTGVSVSRSTGVTDRTEEAVAVVTSLVEGSGGEIPTPDLATARHLGEALLLAGVTIDEARAWGADLATPTGRKITWPWLRQTDRRIDAAFLRSCDMSRGEEPFVRVRDGLSAWRHTRAARSKARARTERKEAPSAPKMTPAETAAAMRALAAERAAQKAAQKNTSTTEAEHHGG
jgi:hypothetical protein